MASLSSFRPRIGSAMVIAAFCFGQVLSAQDQNAQRDVTEIIAAAEPGVVRIDVNNGESLGSGFVVEADGIIVTNAHVLLDADTAVASFSDGKSYAIQGTLLMDVTRDICIAKIDAQDLPTLTLLDGLPAKGEPVVAIGCPLGLSMTATQGSVSAIRKSEELARDSTFNGFRGTLIQVDVALSPGNSGGPILDRKGNVIAMSTLASFGQAQNLNFGVSSIEVRSAIKLIDRTRMAQLKRQTPAPSVATRPRLGRGNPPPNVSPAPSGGTVIIPDPTDDLMSPLMREFLREVHPGFPFDSTPRRSPEPPANTEPPKPIDNVRPDFSVPTEAIAEYIDAGRRLYPILLRDLRQEISKMNKELESKERSLTKNDGPHSSIQHNGYQLSQFLELQKKRDAKQSLLEGFSPKLDDASLIRLLMHYGPPLTIDRSKKYSLGFIHSASIARTVSDECCLILSTQGGTSLLWSDPENTSPLAERPTGPAMYVHHEHVNVPDRQSTKSMSIPILVQLTESQISDVLFKGRDADLKSVVRTWTDASGRFAVDATYVDTQKGIVRLKKSDGTMLSIPLEKLSEADRKLLGAQ